MFFSKELACRIEKAFVDSYRIHMELIQKEFPNMKASYLDFPGGLAAHVLDGNASSYVHGLGLLADFDEKVIEEIESFYFDYKSPSKIQLSALASEKTFETLGKRGYMLTAVYNATVKKISKKDHEPPELPANIRIETKSDNNENIWSKTISDGFVDLIPTDDLPIDLWQSVFRCSDKFAHTVFYEEQAAGASQLSCLNGIAMFNGASTIEKFRGKGIQNLLIKLRLHKAAIEDCEYATLGADNDSTSLRNAIRNGFEVVNSRLVMVKPYPETEK